MSSNNIDVIVIGAGLGGLTAGAKLAREGKKVFMIEQHYIPGGCATTFDRKDYTMEAGLHEMDGLDESDPKIEAFKDLGVFDNIELIRIPEFYRLINKRFDIVIPDNTKEAIEVLIKAFPDEAQGIRKFFKIIIGIRKEVNRMPFNKWLTLLLFPIFPVLYPMTVVSTGRISHMSALTQPLFWLLRFPYVFWKYRTLGDLLDDVIKDEDLKLILGANLAYYHDDPHSMSLIYFSMAQAGYFEGGGHFIKGGSQKLSDYLAKVIEDNGGDVLLKHKVTEIITEDDKAIGVKYRDVSRTKDIETKTAFADIVIANAAVPNVANLLSGKPKDTLLKKTGKLKPSCSLLSIHLGFKKEIKGLGNKHYSTFYLNESIKSLQDIRAGFRSGFDKRPFVFVDYSQIDSGLTPEGKCFGTICTVDYLEDWDTLSNEEYKKKKEEVADTILSRLEASIPGIRDEIECYEVGTPKTIVRYTLNPHGSVYGFAQIPSQAGLFRVKNKAPVANLYFASAWAMPGGGFTGAIISGWRCAKEILGF